MRSPPSYAWLLVLSALACGACDQVLGLGQYTLACDAGNGGCGGSGGAPSDADGGL